MPEIDPDPVFVFFYGDYDNSTNNAASEATIVEARLLLGSGAQILTWTFDVAPDGSGVVAAGQTVVGVQHQKVAGSGSGDSAATPCQYCSAGAATLQLDVDVDGTTVYLEEPTETYGCAF